MASCVYHLESSETSQPYLYIDWALPDNTKIELVVRFLVALAKESSANREQEVHFTDPELQNTLFLLKKTSVVAKNNDQGELFWGSVDILTWNTSYLLTSASIWLLSKNGVLEDVQIDKDLNHFIVIGHEIRAILIGKKDDQDGTLVSTIVVYQ